MENDNLPKGRDRYLPGNMDGDMRIIEYTDWRGRKITVIRKGRVYGDSIFLKLVVIGLLISVLVYFIEKNFLRQPNDVKETPKEYVNPWRR